MMKYTIVASLFVCLLSGCLKDELPVPVQPRGEGRDVQVCMGAGYQDQLWLDVRTGAVLGTNPKTDWDLSFESSALGWRIRLNGATLMTAWNRGPVDITMAHDTTGMSLARRIDAPSGHPDSTAIGDWRGRDDLYIIDMGVNALGQPLGLRKFRFNTVDASGFSFETAAMDGSDLNTVFVAKDDTRSTTCYKLGQGVVPIEPANGQWDLVVTQYTHQFYDPFLPYIVTGVLSAPTTRVAIVPDADINAVTLSDTLAHPFSSARDAIGYAWKYYSFETSSYTVDRTLVYIIQDAEGFFYKMHFIDFYSEQGQVGCPLFSVIQL